MKRQRGRNRNYSNKNNNKNNNNPNRSLDSNGPDVKVRGNASTIYEKYVQLARDATTNGGRVKAENYLQHAEHYLRLVNVQEAEKKARQEERDAEMAARRAQNPPQNNTQNSGHNSGQSSGQNNNDDNEGGDRRPRRQERRPKAEASNQASDADMMDSADVKPRKKPARAKAVDKSSETPAGLEMVELDAAAPKRRRAAPKRKPKDETVDAAQ